MFPALCWHISWCERGSSFPSPPMFGCPFRALRRNTLFTRESMTGKRNSRSLHFGRDDNSVVPATGDPGHTPTQRRNCHPDRSGGTCCFASPVMVLAERREYLTPVSSCRGSAKTHTVVVTGSANHSGGETSAPYIRSKTLPSFRRYDALSCSWRSRNSDYSR